MIRKNTKQCYANRRLFFAVLSIIFILFGAYIYFVSAAVAHVVVRKEIGKEIVNIQAQISDLEAEYIMAKDRVAEDMAYERGFQKNEKKVFVTRETSLVLLSRNDQR